MNLHLDQAVCGCCDRRWQAVFNAEAEELECPECGEMTSIETMPDLLKPPLHIVISELHDAIFVKVTKEVDRLYVAGLLNDALWMINQSGNKVCKPTDDGSLDVFVTVNRRRSNQAD